MAPAGGPEAFLEDHAVMVMSDHSQIPVEARVNLADVLSPWRLLAPADVAPDEAEVAICPAARSAMVYALDEDKREQTKADLVEDLTDVDGIDLVSWRTNGEAAVRSAKGELRFAPGGDLADDRGGTLERGGRHRGAGPAHLRRTRVSSGAYPDALGRLWSALTCVQSGDVLLSGTPGYEFVDWGGSDHVGGGSHGSLHASDSEGVLITCGVGPGSAEEKPSWSLRDVRPDGPRLLRGTRRRTCGRTHGSARVCAASTTGCSSVKFCAVGASGYVVNLVVFTLAVKVRGLHHLVGATLAFVVAVTNNFLWNRHWTFAVRSRPRGLPGRALLHGERRGLRVRRRACSSCWSAASGCPRSRPRRSRSWRPRPLNFIGNKMWSFALGPSPG